MAEPRVVGGVSCFEVLARLSDYLDGTLEPQEKQQVEAHLEGCDTCSSFGGEFEKVMGAARRLLGKAEDAAARK